MSIDDDSRADVISRVPGHGVVQLRHDLLAETRPRPQSIAFGVLSTRRLIARWRSRTPDARRRWEQTIGARPRRNDAQNASVGLAAR